MLVVLLFGYGALQAQTAAGQSGKAEHVDSDSEQETVVEIVTFKLMEGVSVEAFRPLDEAVELQHVAKQPGFISRESAAGDEGDWLVIVHWRSATDADASMARFMSEPAAEQFMSKIDASSMSMKRYTLTRQPEPSKEIHMSERAKIEATIQNLYQKVFNAGQADLLPTLIAGPYIQHNPLFPDGTEPLIGYLEKAGSLPCEIKRIAIDGDLAFVHVRYPDWMGKEHAAVDVFRFNEEGKIVEHWDVLQPVPETAANDNTMF